jgi:hypothetical protein
MSRSETKKRSHSEVADVSSRPGNKVDKNFQVGDIVCVSTYPGRDHWQQVGEIVEVHPDRYIYRCIQFRTIDCDWTTQSRMGLGLGDDRRSLRRGDWHEEQTCRFLGKTLEQAQKEKEQMRPFFGTKLEQAQKEKDAHTRQIVREEVTAILREEVAAILREEVAVILREEILPLVRIHSRT